MPHVILKGNLSEGYKVIGPFSTFDDAAEICDEQRDDRLPMIDNTTWIMEVEQYPHWLNNGFQYARLIEELQGVGAFTPAVMKALAESMDLAEEEVAELMERAQTDWDATKAKLPGFAKGPAPGY
jgi:hypothetical protein